MSDPLAALHEAIRACRRCEEVRGATPVVEGHAGARILVVGQAPGKQEDVLGRPWMGSAGQRLMRWMVEGVGFSSAETFRRQAAFASLTRCFPGPHPSGRGDRRPSLREVANCAPHLDREIAILKPGLILPVGGMAIARFFGPARLDDVIGRAFEQEIAGVTACLIPLPHPSGASSWLNDPAHQAKLQTALGLIRDTIVKERLAGF